MCVCVGYHGRAARYRGVKLESPPNAMGRPWMARIQINGRRTVIGRYASGADAARAYDRVALARGPFHSKPVVTNFPANEYGVVAVTGANAALAALKAERAKVRVMKNMEAALDAKPEHTTSCKSTENAEKPTERATSMKAASPAEAESESATTSVTSAPSEDASKEYLTDYEREREFRIARNKETLEELLQGKRLGPAPKMKKKRGPPKPKPEKVDRTRFKRQCTERAYLEPDVESE